MLQSVYQTTKSEFFKKKLPSKIGQVKLKYKEYNTRQNEIHVVAE